MTQTEARIIRDIFSYGNHKALTPKNADKAREVLEIVARNRFTEFDETDRYGAYVHVFKLNDRG